MAVFCLTASAQTDSVETKKFSHCIGLQANLLIKQILNLNSSNAEIENPFLLIYSINNNKTGFGIHAGLGFEYNQIIDKGEPLNRQTRFQNLNYRIGIEKKFLLGQRFEGGGAIDFVGLYSLDKTFNITANSNGFSFADTSKTTVTDKTVGLGGGLQLSLTYAITKKILIGTEASMYFTTQSFKENILIIRTITEFNNNQQSTSTTNFNSETKNEGFNLTVPVAIYLIVKL